MQDHRHEVGPLAASPTRLPRRRRRAATARPSGGAGRGCPAPVVGRRRRSASSTPPPRARPTPGRRAGRRGRPRPRRGPVLGDTEDGLQRGGLPARPVGVVDDRDVGRQGGEHDSAGDDDHLVEAGRRHGVERPGHDRPAPDGASSLWSSPPMPEPASRRRRPGGPPRRWSRQPRLSGSSRRCPAGWASCGRCGGR